jgi:hypothetical protein
MSYIAHCLMVALSPIQPSWFFPWQFFPSITRPGKRLHNELERSTILELAFYQLFRLGHGFNSYIC